MLQLRQRTPSRRGEVNHTCSGMDLCPRSSWYSPPTTASATPASGPASGWRSSPRRTTSSATRVSTSRWRRPRAAQPPVDPEERRARMRETPAMKRFRNDPEAQRALANTRQALDVSADDYDAVFYPGGHGPLWDLAEDRSSIALIERLYAAGKPVAAVCHGPAVLRQRQRTRRGPAGQRKDGDGLRQHGGGRGGAHEGRAVPGRGRAHGQRRQVLEGGRLGEPRRGGRQPDHRAEPGLFRIDGEGAARDDGVEGRGNEEAGGCRSGRSVRPLRSGAAGRG